MIDRRTFVASLVIAPLLAGGCSKVREEKKEIALEATTNNYHRAIRWGYYQAAYGYVHPDKRGEVPAYLENVRVTSYDVVQPPVMQDDTTATQIVEIEYLHRDRQVIKRIADRQEWRLDPETGVWWLHSGVPEFE